MGTPELVEIWCQDIEAERSPTVPAKMPEIGNVQIIKNRLRKAERALLERLLTDERMRQVWRTLSSKMRDEMRWTLRVFVAMCGALDYCRLEAET